MRELMIAKIIFLCINGTLAVVNIAIALIFLAVFGIVIKRKHRNKN